jgi:cell wall-associated NlpC family hydrolase
VGAFSVLENAVRLTRYLNNQGENAFYFRHESGLFKVRIGDFATREEALSKARKIVAQGLVDSYYIVSPDQYALARSRTLGTNVLREEIVKTAIGFIGLPYQWGGASPDQGFDCSGLTMVSYQMNGLNIPRSSGGQFRKGRPISHNDLRKGDLVFFSIRSGKKISHVGIYKGEGEFVHAPGAGKTIRVDNLSNPYFTRHYSGARTYF